MKPYLVQTPKFVQRMFPKRVWAFPNSANKVYLTFDDGPIPEVTPWVLDQLKKFNAKATFFCIGDNIRKHPEVFRRVTFEGHAIGNHTFHHLNGRHTTTRTYLEDCLQFDEMLDRVQHHKTTLFRPPYGRLKSSQAKALQKKGYAIIMWDVLSADFDPRISEEQCLQNVLGNIKAGSIVVFHDSLKAQHKLRYVLPAVLEEMEQRGLTSDRLLG